MTLLHIEKGKILNRHVLIDFLDMAPDWDYVIKKYVKNRTNDQNRYYRWLLEIVEKETGQEKEVVHERMRMKFLSVNEDGKLPYCKSTQSLTTEEMSAYIEQIRNFMSTFWIILPDADKRHNLYA